MEVGALSPLWRLSGEPASPVLMISLICAHAVVLLTLPEHCCEMQ